MPKILITGSLGLVGSEAVKFFKEKGWKVVGIDNNMRAQFFETEKVAQGEVLDIDIRNQIYINDLFKKHKFDAIIHCAAQPSHDYSKDHVLEDFDINARGTLILLEATRKYCPEAVFVHVSTDKVYGTNMDKTIPTRSLSDENLGLDFASRSPFGCSKTAADIYAQEYARYFDMRVGVFRPGCITGKAHKGAELHGFLAYLVKCIKEGKTYNIFGYNGKQVRDQIHAYDLVNAFFHFIQDPRPGEVYNIGGGPERAGSVMDMISLIEKEIGKQAVYNYIDEPRKSDRMFDIHDISKFRSHYPGWDYKFSLQDIIKELCS